MMPICNVHKYPARCSQQLDSMHEKLLIGLVSSAAQLLRLTNFAARDSGRSSRTSIT